MGLNTAVFLAWQYAFMKQGQGDYSLLQWMEKNFYSSWNTMLDGRLWTMVTCAFSHNTLPHFALNMFVLHSFGQAAIYILGAPEFLLFYLAAGAASSAAHLIYSRFIEPEIRKRPTWFPKHIYTQSHGASGAISASTLLYALTYPWSTVNVFIFIKLPAIVAIGGFVAYDIYMASTGKQGKQLKSVLSLHTPTTTPGTCETHNAPLFYFCQTCSEALCADCAVMLPLHKSHTLQKLQEVYDTHRKNVETSLDALKTRLGTYKSLLMEATKGAELVHSYHAKAQEDVKRRVAEVFKTLGAQCFEKRKGLEEFKKTLQGDLERGEAVAAMAEERLQRSTWVELISKSSSVVEALKAGAREREPDALKVPEASLDFDTDLTAPPFETFNLKIDKFFERRVEKQVVFEESQKTAAGLEWKLRVYTPSAPSNEGEIGIFIQLLKGPAEGGLYEYTIEFVPQNATSLTNGQNPASLTKTHISTFHAGVCHRIPHGLKLEDLEPSGFWQKEQDTLQIRWGVRNTSWRGRCRDMEWSLGLLKSSVAALGNVSAVSSEQKGIETDVVVDVPKPYVGGEPITPVNIMKAELEARERLQAQRPIAPSAESFLGGSNDRVEALDTTSALTVVPCLHLPAQSSATYNAINYSAHLDENSPDRASDHETSPEAEADGGVYMQDRLDELRRGMQDFEEFVDGLSREIHDLETNTSPPQSSFQRSPLSSILENTPRRYQASLYPNTSPQHGHHSTHSFLESENDDDDEEQDEAGIEEALDHLSSLGIDLRRPTSSSSSGHSNSLTAPRRIVYDSYDEEDDMEPGILRRTAAGPTSASSSTSLRAGSHRVLPPISSPGTEMLADLGFGSPYAFDTDEEDDDDADGRGEDEESKERVRRLLRGFGAGSDSEEEYESALEDED
ncbi:hypothetical protein HDV05_005829 [Chytridiales sp. JEL 0842]|nr:hypothetical protein HDV05_005829 [Chytridiales sp. JEL 0842]